MEKFTFPQHLGIRLDTVLKAFAALIPQEVGKTSVVEISFAKTTHISPAGYAILSCLLDTSIEQAAKLRCHSFSKEFREIPVVSLLSAKNHPTSLMTPSAYDFNRPLFMLRGYENSISVTFPEEIEDRFAARIGEDLYYDARLVITELMQNAVDHSGAERYYLYAGVERDAFHIGSLDMGVTLPGKLQQKFSFADDVTYIEHAMQHGVTTRRKRAGGLGLYYFTEHLKTRNGNLAILSRGGSVRSYFANRNISRKLMKTPLQGTWCFARFPIP